jgi:hypothetical protein
VPAGACAQTRRDDWFRNLSGTTAFGRRQNSGGSCQTSAAGLDLTAADYSLQMAATVDRALDGDTFNPCTWDEDNPLNALVTAPVACAFVGVRIFTRYATTAIGKFAIAPRQKPALRRASKRFSWIPRLRGDDLRCAQVT